MPSAQALALSQIERILNRTEAIRTTKGVATQMTKLAVVGMPRAFRTTKTSDPIAALVEYNGPRRKMDGVCAKNTSRNTPPNAAVITPKTGATIHDAPDSSAKEAPGYAHSPKPNASTTVTQPGSESLRITRRTGLMSGSSRVARSPCVIINIPITATTSTVKK